MVRLIAVIVFVTVVSATVQAVATPREFSYGLKGLLSRAQCTTDDDCAGASCCNTCTKKCTNNQHLCEGFCTGNCKTNDDCPGAFCCNTCTGKCTSTDALCDGGCKNKCPTGGFIECLNATSAHVCGPNNMDTHAIVTCPNGQKCIPVKLYSPNGYCSQQCVPFGFLDCKDEKHPHHCSRSGTDKGETVSCPPGRTCNRMAKVGDIIQADWCVNQTPVKNCTANGFLGCLNTREVHYCNKDGTDKNDAIFCSNGAICNKNAKVGSTNQVEWCSKQTTNCTANGFLRCNDRLHPHFCSKNGTDNGETITCENGLMCNMTAMIGDTIQSHWCANKNPTSQCKIDNDCPGTQCCNTCNGQCTNDMSKCEGFCTGKCMNDNDCYGETCCDTCTGSCTKNQTLCSSNNNCHKF